MLAVKYKASLEDGAVVSKCPKEGVEFHVQDGTTINFEIDY
jgi:hypothetical protein